MRYRGLLNSSCELCALNMPHRQGLLIQRCGAAESQACTSQAATQQQHSAQMAQMHARLAASDGENCLS